MTVLRDHLPLAVVVLPIASEVDLGLVCPLLLDMKRKKHNSNIFPGHSAANNKFIPMVPESNGQYLHIIAGLKKV